MNRRFKGIWIPAAIWLSSELRVGEKIMLVEIESLEDEFRGCYASNAHFAEFFGLSVSRVSEVISALEQKGFIQVTQKRDGVRVVERQIRLTKSFEDMQTSSEKAMNPFGKGDEPPSEKAKGSNTKILSNTKKIKDSCDQQAEHVPVDQIFDIYEKVLPSKPRVRIRDDARRKAVRSIWNRDKKFQSVEFWEKYFGVVRNSPFLMSQKTFAFDWLVKPANFKKVAEGNYSND